MEEEILFRIPFTLYFIGFENVEILTGRIRYKRFLCLYRKKFMDTGQSVYVFIKI